MDAVNLLSSAVTPLIIAFCAAACLVDRRYFDSLLDGMRDGLKATVNLLPTLIALIVAVSMFTGSGMAELLSGLLSPVCSRLGIPAEIVPLLVARPVSGGASTALLASIFEQYGPDSFPSLCASVIAGSSDTLIYVVSVYYSAVSVKNTRRAYVCAAVVMVFCVFLSCAVVRIFF